MNTLDAFFTPAVVEAIEDLVDARVEALLVERENGSQPAWMSIEEAARYLRVSPSTIARMLKRGDLRSSFVGRRRLVRCGDPDQQSGWSAVSQDSVTVADCR